MATLKIPMGQPAEAIGLAIALAGHNDGLRLKAYRPGVIVVEAERIVVDRSVFNAHRVSVSWYGLRSLGEPVDTFNNSLMILDDQKSMEVSDDG